MPILQNIQNMPELTRWQRLKLRVRTWAAMKLLGDEPLIYTSNGNVPIASVQRVVQWDDRADCVVHTEAYVLPGTEIVVKKSADVMMKQGASMGAQQQTF